MIVPFIVDFPIKTGDCKLNFLLNIAIEIVDLPIKHGGSFHSYVKLPEGICI